VGDLLARQPIPAHDDLEHRDIARERLGSGSARR
jgi:hypothetical protein